MFSNKTQQFWLACRLPFDDFKKERNFIRMHEKREMPKHLKSKLVLKEKQLSLITQ